MPERRIIIVEARPVRRQRLTSLAKAEADVTLVASCGTLMEAYTAIEAEVPDLVLISRKMTEVPEHSMLASLIRLLDVAELTYAEDLQEDGVLVLAKSPTARAKPADRRAGAPSPSVRSRLVLQAPKRNGIRNLMDEPAPEEQQIPPQKFGNPHPGSLKSAEGLATADGGEAGLLASGVRQGENSAGRGTNLAISAASGRTEPIILIGASTGGVEALHQILPKFPPDCPPIVVVQHIRGSFSSSFAERLDRICAAKVIEARSGRPLQPGQVLIAPGDQTHLILAGRHPIQTQLVQGPAVTGHRPSVDALFHSALPLADRVVACLLTGMGADGARGLLALKEAGAQTIAQDQESSTVYGMPRVAAELGAATRILPLSQIAQAILAGSRGAARSASVKI